MTGPATTAVAAPPTAPAPAADLRSERPMSKTDQWICWWSILIFFNLFGLIFVLLTRVMPPPRPDKSPEQVVAFFDAHSLTIKIGFGLLMVVVGWASWSNGLVASITGLAIFMLFWPLLSRGLSLLRPRRNRDEPGSTG